MADRDDAGQLEPDPEFASSERLFAADDEVAALLARWTRPPGPSDPQEP